MIIHRTNFVLALCVGAGMIAFTAPLPARAQQDRGAQSQDNRGQKPAAQGKQQHAAERPKQGKPATSRPQTSHAQAARPAHTTKPAARPSHPQANHPQTGKPAATRPSHNTSHNNARPTTKPAARPTHGRPSNGRPSNGRPSNGRPATKPGSRPNYQFRSQDTTRLRNYYRGGFGKINRRNRPSFSRGGYVPRTYWTYFQPVPGSLIGYLPPVPPGYVIGYYDGYIIVYDPSNWFILSVLNILQ